MRTETQAEKVRRENQDIGAFIIFDPEEGEK